jgi:hypothetical protein
LSDSYHSDVRRLVVINLLDRPDGRERADIYRALAHIDQAVVEDAITSLVEAGVVVDSPTHVQTSQALACLERLGLIGV